MMSKCNINLINSMSKNFILSWVYQACRGWKELSIGGSAIFVGGRWAELGSVKNWAKSLHKWNHPNCWSFGFFEKFITKKSTHHNLMSHISAFLKFYKFYIFSHISALFLIFPISPRFFPISPRFYKNIKIQTNWSVWTINILILIHILGFQTRLTTGSIGALERCSLQPDATWLPITKQNDCDLLYILVVILLVYINKPTSKSRPPISRPQKVDQNKPTKPNCRPTFYRPFYIAGQ
jgi:hypothetical protein